MRIDEGGEVVSADEARPLEVRIDEGGEVASADEARPLHERVWSFIDMYCNIL